MGKKRVVWVSKGGHGIRPKPTHFICPKRQGGAQERPNSLDKGGEGEGSDHSMAPPPSNQEANMPEKQERKVSAGGKKCRLGLLDLG